MEKEKCVYCSQELKIEVMPKEAYARHYDGACIENREPSFNEINELAK